MIYCPPKYRISDDNFKEFFLNLGGSGLITTRGRTLYRVIQRLHLNHLSTGEPTYWSTDRNKIPDLIDIFISKGTTQEYLKIESSPEMTSDHTPVIVTISSYIKTKAKPPSLHNSNINWDKFRALDMANAIEQFNTIVQESSRAATPQLKPLEETKYFIPANIREFLTIKRRRRRTWHNTRYLQDKRKFNKTAKKLKKILYELKNENLQNRLQALTPIESTHYSLWRITKRLKQP